MKTFTLPEKEIILPSREGDGGRVHVGQADERGPGLHPHNVPAAASAVLVTPRPLMQEISSNGCSAEGCFERAEIEARLVESRRAAQDRAAERQAHVPTPVAHRAAAPAGGLEDVMAAMTASFNLAGDSFGLMMKKVTDKFDTLDSKLDDLETKRGQLRHTLAKEPTTALGRLNQLKASAGAAVSAA